jgi:hypothetical protein
MSAGATVKLQSPTLSLNMIPDKVFIFVCKLNELANDPDVFLPITNISLQVFNQAGILSSSTQQDLFRMSKEAGYEGTWLDFTGRALKVNDADNPQYIRTSGSVLTLEFGKHIPLQESYYSAGSLCNLSLQYSIDVVNYGADIPSNTYELVLAVMNSGIMTIEKGTSQEFMGILSKAMFLIPFLKNPILKVKLLV